MIHISEILSHYGLAERAPVTLIRESGDNVVYSIGNRSKAILRISKHLSPDEIGFENDALIHLERAHVHVPKIIPTIDGQRCVVVDGMPAVLFEFISGRHLTIDKDHHPTQEEAHNAGMELGALAAAGVSFVSDHPRTRSIATELERAMRDRDVFMDTFEGGRRFISEVEEALASFRSYTGPTGLIHNDFRPSNVLFGEQSDVVAILDMDWSCVGPLIKDLALAALEWSCPDRADVPDMSLLHAFVDGYDLRAPHKIEPTGELFTWIRYSALSDSCTYLCDLIGDPVAEKRITRSYMYRKFLYFSKL